MPALNFRTPRGAPNTGSYLFTHAKMDTERERTARKAGYDTTDPHFMLREVDQNVDVWDTLTSAVVKKMMNPPSQYDPEYEKHVNTVILTALGAVARRANL